MKDVLGDVQLMDVQDVLGVVLMLAQDVLVVLGVQGVVGHVVERVMDVLVVLEDVQVGAADHVILRVV
jgi:uncharacterized membrane protein